MSIQQRNLKTAAGVAALCLLLSSCASPKVFAPVEVQIPISAPCTVEIPQEPNWNLAGTSPGAPLTEKLRNALADLELSKGYAAELRASIEACKD